MKFSNLAVLALVYNTSAVSLEETNTFEMDKNGFLSQDPSMAQDYSLAEEEQEENSLAETEEEEGRRHHHRRHHHRRHHHHHRRHHHHHHLTRHEKKMAAKVEMMAGKLIMHFASKVDIHESVVDSMCRKHKVPAELTRLLNDVFNKCEGSHRTGVLSVA